MNKLILIALSLLLASNVYAADQKVSALGAVNPANADTIYVIQGGASQKATVSNLFAAATDLDADGVIAANSVALGTDTTGNYLATLADSGAGEVTVANSGTETAAVTLAIASGITRDTEWDSTVKINAATTDTDFSTISHRHEGQVLGVTSLGATTVTGNTVSGNTINIGGFGRVSVYQCKSFVLLSPTAGVTYNTVKFPYTITIRKIDVICHGGAPGSTRILGGLDEANSNGVYVSAIDSDIAALSGTNYSDDGSLSNPSVDAGDYLNWHTSGVTGTVTAATVTFLYTIDAGTQIP